MGFVLIRSTSLGALPHCSEDGHHAGGTDGAGDGLHQVEGAAMSRSVAAEFFEGLQVPSRWLPCSSFLFRL